MAHSQGSIRDHARERHQPHVEVSEIAEHLENLLTPAIHSQQGYYRQLGMRSRILTLPLMVAAVLTLLWRNVPSVRELNRMLARENLLWASAVKVSQSALSERFLTFPSELFEGVLKALLPVLSQRWQGRRFRPLPESLLVARRHFPRIWIADGSTLEALFRKLKSLEDVPLGQLAGKICAVIDLTTRLPVEVGFCTRPYTHETQFGTTLLSQVSPGTLLVLDRGFWDYSLFANIIDRQAAFITIDLGDEVADAFELPNERISLEMLWRSFYHFVNARARGDTQDWLSYILREDNQDLGVVKPLRKGRLKPPIDLSPTPGDRTLDK